ncbi:MAG: hypothetical protein HQL39_06100 [Alphaproteobacteria bacterium]|nr:hypothetical protein [Alphaproteobacteria bacterium]
MASEDQSCPFAQHYKQAHDEAGLIRFSLKPALRGLAADPDPLYSEALFSLEALGFDMSELTPHNRDRLIGNTLLSFLFRDYHRYAKENFPLLKTFKAGLFADEARAPGPYASNRDMVSYFHHVRDANCNAMNSIVKAWLADIDRKIMRVMDSGEEVSPTIAAYVQANRFLRHSELYKGAKHSLQSICLTGSNTALHLCWCLVEGAIFLTSYPTVEDYLALVRRSRKELLPLASGSLGMVVTYLDASGLHPHDGVASNPPGPDTHALKLQKDANGDDIMRLDPGPIRPFMNPGDPYYTGCPAFYVGGMIETYLEIVCDVALHYNVFPVGEGVAVPA